jgi:signal transduction histidine kinase
MSPSTEVPPRQVPASYAPTVIDRTVDRVQHAAPMLTRLTDGAFVIAIALFGVADLLTAGSLSFSRPVASGIWSLGTVALAVVAVIAVALRRTQLVGATVALCGASIGLTTLAYMVATPLTPSFAALFGIALLVARAVRIEPAGTAIALAALGGVAVAAETIRTMSTAWPLLFVLCEFCFGLAVGGGAYLRWVDWRRVVAADAARQDERLEIARELHDLVGHYVTGIIVQAQAARHVAAAQPDAAAASLEQIELAGGQAMAAMRRMVGGLRDDSPVAPSAGWDDLQRVVDDAAAAGLPVRLTIDPDAATVQADLAMSAHRIVSESLTNVRRHALDVTAVDVHVGVERGIDPARRAGRDRIVVSVTDDGLPAAVATHDTYGLIGMHERAEALGGSLYAGPGPSGGWLVRAELPLDTA